MTRLPCSSSLPFCVCIISLHVLSVCQAFLTIPTATSHARLVLSSSIRRSASTVVVCSTVTPSSAETNTSSPSSNPPTWESKQHLYGVDMILSNEMDASSNSMSVTLDADGAEVTAASGDYLPLPQTYITCGKCNSLFAIAEEDLGKGKGCRVKCTVCTNTWYQSRDRLFDIPTETHDMIPANKSDLDRIARNLAHDCPPNFMGVNKLYVGNLDFRTTSDELLEFFERNSDKAGSVCDVSMVKGPDGRSRGFAFVTFYEEADGKAALMCNGMECNGRELSVKEPNN